MPFILPHSRQRAAPGGLEGATPRAGSNGLDGGALDEASLDGAVLVACDDHAIEFLAGSHEELSARYVLDDSIPGLMRAMLDKPRSMELAAKAGVPVPMRWEVQSRDELARLLHEFTCPVIVKPVHSHLFQNVLGNGGRKFLVADTEVQLKLIDRISRDWPTSATSC